MTLSRRPLAAVFIVLSSVGLFFLTRQLARKPALQDPHVYNVPLAGAELRGPTDARVTIVEFGDLDCSACRDAHPVVEKLLAAFPRDVRFAWMFAQSATRRGLLAQKALTGARAQNGFWPMYAQLMAVSREDVDEHVILLSAAAAGLDAGALKTFLHGREASSLAAQDIAVSKSMGVRRLPTFFVNGRRLEGAVSLDTLEDVVRGEIRRADRMLKTGVPREKLYETLTQTGLKTVIASKSKLRVNP